MLLNVVTVIEVPTLPLRTVRTKHWFKLPTVKTDLATIVLANIEVTENVMPMVAGTRDVCNVR